MQGSTIVRERKWNLSSSSKKHRTKFRVFEVSDRRISVVLYVSLETLYSSPRYLANFLGIEAR